MITLIVLIAGQIAIQCIGFICKEVSPKMIMELASIGLLELIFESYGVIKIYKRRDEHDDTREDD